LSGSNLIKIILLKLRRLSLTAKVFFFHLGYALFFQQRCQVFSVPQYFSLLCENNHSFNEFVYVISQQIEGNWVYEIFPTISGIFLVTKRNQQKKHSQSEIPCQRRPPNPTTWRIWTKTSDCFGVAVEDWTSPIFLLLF